MRRRAPSPRLKTGTAGDGPADTATVVIGLAAGEQAEGPAAGMLREAAGLDLTFIHAPGDPVAGLLRIAGEVHADLIVVVPPAM
jgi:nucleotide-binding universal stress UspA family protein